MSVLYFIIPFVYLILFSALILNTRWFRFSHLSKKVLTGLFAAKVLAGTVYVALYKYVLGPENVDIFNYFRDSGALYQIAWTQPRAFLRMFVWCPGFPIPADIHPLFDRMGYWTVWGDYTMIRYNTILRFFTMGNVWGHMIITCFIGLLGQTALFEFFYRNVREQKYILAGAVFLFPSVLFWGSGLHKEQLILAGLGGVLYQFFMLLRNKRSAAQLFVLLISIVVIFFLRGYVIVLLLPALVGFVWNDIHPRHTAVKYIGIYGGVVVLLYVGLQLIGSVDIFEVLVQKRRAFQQLSGETSFNMEPMQATLYSVIVHIPQALVNTLIRPFPLTMNTMLSITAGIENYVFLLLAVAALWSLIKQGRRYEQTSNILGFSLCFGISFLLLIGLTVNNVGTIMRYKAQVYPFLLVVIIMLVAPENRIRDRRERE